MGYSGGIAIPDTPTSILYFQALSKCGCIWGLALSTLEESNGYFIIKQVSPSELMTQMEN